VTTQQLRIRWIRPAWLDWDQAVIYSGLPVHVLRALIAARRLRTREKGTLIIRDSIDQVLLEATLTEPIFWKQTK
jgi:hypothetical protein